MKGADRAFIATTRKGSVDLVRTAAGKRGDRPGQRIAKALMIMDHCLQSENDFNPYHDKSGRFASRGGASGGGEQWYSNGKRMTVAGPKSSKQFIKNYFAKHPAVEKEAAKYKNVRASVMNFEKEHPNAQEGTYSATTGKLVDPSEIPGVCVTFHQNNAADDPFGGYDDDDYAAMCAIAKNELGCKDVYIGYFGNAEVSFTCTDKQKAMDFAIEHNQHSVYDPATDWLGKNPYYHPSKNRIEGH